MIAASSQALNVTSRTRSFGAPRAPQRHHERDDQPRFPDRLLEVLETDVQRDVRTGERVQELEPEAKHRIGEVPMV